MHTFEGLELNNLFFVLFDIGWFDFFHVGWLSEITGFLIAPLDFIFLMLLVIFNWVYTTRNIV